MNDISYALGIVAKKTGDIKKKEAALNAKVNDLRQKFDLDTVEDKTEIEMLNKDIENFCMLHKTEFDQTRTLQFKTGKVGFRTNPPKVMQLNKKFSVASTIELVKKILKGAFLRVKEDLDKDAILTSYRSGEVDDKKLASVGLRIDQGETFFIEPAWEELETVVRQTVRK